jgi:3-(3-hydroxy-phenyl)propionate hydroxylase
MLRPGEDKQSMLDRARVRDLIGGWIDADRVELIRSAVYDFHALVAKDWSTRRVFLAGDSAHQTPPFLGQGMCAGMRDAANLGWKLAMVLGGTASPRILQSYQPEREPHVRGVIETAIAMGRIICTLDPDAAQARDASWLARSDRLLSAPELPGIRTGIVFRDNPMSGTLGLQARIRDESGRIALLDDVVGPGFTLLQRSHGASPLCPEARAFFERIGGKSIEIGPEMDVDRAYARWFDEHGCDAVLVRPDHQVFGAACGDAAGSDLIDSLAAQIS